MQTFWILAVLAFLISQVLKHVAARKLLENATTCCISQFDNQASIKPLNICSFLFGIWYSYW